MTLSITAERCYAERHLRTLVVMLNVIMLNVVMLTVTYAECHLR